MLNLYLGPARSSFHKTCLFNPIVSQNRSAAAHESSGRNNWQTNYSVSMTTCSYKNARWSAMTHLLSSVWLALSVTHVVLSEPGFWNTSYTHFPFSLRLWQRLPSNMIYSLPLRLWFETDKVTRERRFGLTKVLQNEAFLQQPQGTFQWNPSSSGGGTGTKCLMA